ncbi:MAG: LptF/LptG family permease [Holophagaceae bacterium]|nr:LptF/LptG family permease [Holophagaceae bacterium]
MPIILIRYFLRRWGLQILAGFGFFGGLLLAWEIKSISKILFDQQASIYHLAPLLLTTIPWNVGLILPMAAVLGGLLGTQYLSEGSEFVALQGLGCGKRGFIIPWGVLSVILMLGSVINAHWVSPWASRMEKQLFYNLAQETAQSGGYMPKTGEEPKLLKNGYLSQSQQDSEKSSTRSSGHSIYWGMSSDDNKLHIMQISSDSVSHLIGDKYTFKLEKVISIDNESFDSMQLSFRFEDVFGKASARNRDVSGRLMDLSYKTFEVNQQIQIEKQAYYQPTAVRHLSTSELFATSNRVDSNNQGLARVELSRRFSNPIACCALLLLGIAIGLSHPRFYRGGGFVKSIGVILLYFVIVKVVEGWIENNTINWVYASFLVPLFFLLAGWLLLLKKMYPARHGQRKKTVNKLFGFFQKSEADAFGTEDVLLSTQTATNSGITSKFIYGRDLGRNRKNLIGRWTSRKWWANFAGVLAIFVVFHVFMEFAGLAQWVSIGEGRLWIFVKYWIYNLPVTLPFILPVVFLLAWVLTFSDASISREWVALRAGGVSLIQWVRSSWKSWSLAIFAVFVIEAYVSPLAYAYQDRYYKQVKVGKQDSHTTMENISFEETPTTLFLGATGIFWYSEGQTRWGFPLLSQTLAPSILYWEKGQTFTQQLNWNDQEWLPGVSAETLFPAASLRQYQKAEEIPTLDLFTWQAWAPSGVRGTMLWGRLLKWLIGPCLFFASLGFAFPHPRMGRGQALGHALILSLLFMWLQNLFEGAAKAGQIPPYWGVIAPMIALIGFGLLNLRRLHT